MPLKQASQCQQAYLNNEDGNISILALFLFVTFAGFAAIGLDFSNFRSERTLMQNTADAAAHAALYVREMNDKDTAVAAALDIVEDMMPEDVFGTVADSGDVVFGSFDYDTRAFTADEDSTSAVRVSVSRNSEKSNQIATYLFKLVGLDSFNASLDSVFVTYQPTCFTEGFVAEVEVDIQSNNSFYDGFCIHSNGVVSINSKNYFEEGTIVSMTNLSNLDIPASGEDSNDGLTEALREGSYRLRIVNRIPTIIDSLYAGEDTYMPDYITSTEPLTLSGSKFDVSEFTEGRIHLMSCTNGKATISGDVLNKVVLLTDCEVKFSQGLQITSSVLATTNTSDSSFNAPSSVTFGLDDGCEDGGSALLLTEGGMSFASDMHIYGSQLLAVGDIVFSANADGVEGASIISGGTISGTSRMNMAYCGSGMDDVFSADYFRMAF